jgi:hypothetical protein
MQPTISQFRQLARTALDQKGVAARRLRWMGEDSNHQFRVDTAVGDRLVVRMCLPDGRSDAELAELARLAALAPRHRPVRPAGPLQHPRDPAELPTRGRFIAFGWFQARHCEANPSPPAGRRPLAASSPCCRRMPGDSARRAASPA